MDTIRQSSGRAPFASRPAARRLLPMMITVVLELSPLIAVAVVLKLF